MNKTNDSECEFTFSEQQDFEKGFLTTFNSELSPVLQQMKAKHDRNWITSKRSMGLAIITLIALGVFNLDQELFMLGILVVVILAMIARIGFQQITPKKASKLDIFLFTVSFGVVAAFAVFHINDDLYILFWFIAFFTFLLRLHKQNLDGTYEIPFIMGRFLGYKSTAGAEVDIDQAANLGLFHYEFIQSLNKTMSSTHKSHSFEITNARVAKYQFILGTNKPKVTFNGLLMKVTTHVNAPRLHFIPRSHLKYFNKYYLSSYVNMEQLELADSEFTDLYVVYTDQPDHARFFINQQLIEGLIWLSQDSVFQNRITGCAMAGNQMFLTIQRNKDFLSLGTPFSRKCMPDVESDLHSALSDLTLPLRVIDRFFDLAWTSEKNTIEEVSDNTLIANTDSGDHVDIAENNILESHSISPENRADKIEEPHTILIAKDSLISICKNYDDYGYYILDSISLKKRKNANRYYPSPGEGEIIALIDATVFGSAEYGLMIGEYGVSWNNPSYVNTKINYLYWEDLKLVKISKSGNNILIGEGTFISAYTDLLVSLLTDIQKAIKH